MGSWYGARASSWWREPMTRERRRRMARTSFEAIASPGDRLRAALYDFFIFSAMGSVLLTAFVGVSGRDPLEDGGALLITAVGLVLLKCYLRGAGDDADGADYWETLVGLRVTSLDGTAPGWWRSLRRWALFIPLGLIHDASLADPAIACASIAADSAHRGIHDYFAGTIVIRIGASPRDPLKPRKRR